MFKIPFNKTRRARRSVEGISAAKKPSALRLRPRTIQIEVSRSSLRELRRRSGGILMVLALVLVIVAAGYARQTAAETNLYPQVCLGGWHNSERAAGMPDLDGTDGSKYNDNNSASISDSLGQIFCGNFEGAIPNKTVPTKITVRISWTVALDKPMVLTIPEGSFASSTGAILDLPAGSGLQVIAPSSTLPFPAFDASSTEQSPPGAPNDTAPSDVPHTPVETLQPDTSPTTTPSVLHQPTPDQGRSSSPQSLLRDIAHFVVGSISPQIAHAEASASSTNGAQGGGASSTPPDTATAASSSPAGVDSVSATSSSAEEGVAEVLYSLDGATWHSLGIVPRTYIENASFEIPIDGIRSCDPDPVSLTGGRN